MSFVPLQPSATEAAAAAASRPVRKAKPLDDAALLTTPVQSSIAADASGAFVIRALDDALLPASQRASEARRWHTELKIRRKPDEAAAQAASSDGQEEEQEETGEWLHSGSALPAGEESLRLLESLVQRVGMLVVIFFRGLTDPSSQAYLSEASLRLLPNIRKKDGRIIGVSASAFTPDQAAAVKAEHVIEFPLLVDPSATLCKRYRMLVNKTGKSFEGVVVLQDIKRDAEVVVGGGSADAAALVAAGAGIARPSSIETLYHVHSVPAAQTDEEADRGDEPEILFQQRVPSPWVVAVRYGLGNKAFKTPKAKVSKRKIEEQERIEASKAAGKEKLGKRADRQRAFFNRHDPDGEDGCRFPGCWCGGGEGDNDDESQKYLARFPGPEVVWKIIVAVWGSQAKEKHLATHAAQLCRSAVKRLARDWREVDHHPLPAITARPPFDNDIFEWHASLTGPTDAKGQATPYTGVDYHLVLKFPRNYPLSPPTVRLRGQIIHSNVFGSYICLDMLTDVATDSGSAPPLWQGWTSAYSVQSILLQLQAFLFDGARMPRRILSLDEYRKKSRSNPEGLMAIDQEWNKDIERSIRASRNVGCDCRDVDPEANQFVKDIQDKPVEEMPITDVVPVPAKTQAKAATPAQPAAAAAATVAPLVAAPVAQAAPAHQAVPAPVSKPVQQSKPVPAPAAAAAEEDEWEVVRPEPKNKFECRAQAKQQQQRPVAAKAPVKQQPAAHVQQQQSPFQKPVVAAAGNSFAAAASSARVYPAPVKPVVVAAAAAPVKVVAQASQPAASAPVASQAAAASAPSAPAPSTAPVPLNDVRPTALSRVLPSFDPWDPRADPDLMYRSSFFGRVQMLTAHGALIDMGLPRAQWVSAHVSQLSDEFINEPSEAVAVGQLVKLRIQRLDAENGRVCVSLKGRLGPLVTPLPVSHAHYPARIAEFTPEGGFRVTLHDGVSTHSAMVRNDSALTRAFGGLHFWSAAEVAATGQKVHVRLVDIAPGGTFVAEVVEAQETITAVETAALFVSKPGGAAASLPSLTSPNALLPLPSAAAAASSSSSLNAARSDPSLLVCFHSKASFRHELLGLPINLEYYSSGELANVHAQLDLLSQTSFKLDGVRAGVSRATFTHWMPLYLDAQHAGDMSAHEQDIADICWKKKESERCEFHPLMVLKVLPALLNTMIVSMMKGHLHESIASLSGYISVFQLLCAFALRYPELQVSASNRLSAFLASENGRSKKECPNLGELLALLTISDEFAWLDVAKVVLGEVMDRNVKWALQAYPELKIKVKEDKMVAQAEAVEAKAGSKGMGKLKLSKEQEAAVKERRRIVLEYQKTGKTPAQQAAEKAALVAAAAEALATKKAEEAAAQKLAAESSAVAAAARASPLSDGHSKSDDEDDYVAIDAADAAASEGEFGFASDDADEEMLAEAAAEAEAAAIAAEPEEVPGSKAAKKRFALLASMDRGRLPKSFKAGRVSYRLVLFHVHFLELFRGLKRDQLVSLPALHRRLQMTLGRASSDVEAAFQRSVQALKLVSTWSSFFAGVRLSVPSDEYMLGWLRHAVDNSLRRRYHNNRPPPLTPAQLAKKAAREAKRTFEARLAEDGDHRDSGHVDFGDFSSR